MFDNFNDQHAQQSLTMAEKAVIKILASAATVALRKVKKAKTYGDLLKIEKIFDNIFGWDTISEAVGRDIDEDNDLEVVDAFGEIIQKAEEDISTAY